MSNHLKYIKSGLFCTLLIAGFTIQSETKSGAERQESLSAPGITVPFFQVVSGLPPASDFLRRFAKPPGHSFGYVPVESVDLRSLIKPARTEAVWIYPHNSDLPQSFEEYRLFVLWQSRGFCSRLAFGCFAGAAFWGVSAALWISEYAPSL